MQSTLSCAVTRASLAALFALLPASTTLAELTDITQTPNAVNEGIKKSLEDQIGMGRGDINTPGSSLYIIKRDPFRAIARGRQLFQRKFTTGQGFGPRENDGHGDISADAKLGAGLADSCAACHGRPRGSAGHGGDVFTRPDSRDAPHLFGLGLVEMLADEMTSELRAQRAQAVTAAQSSGQSIEVNLTAKGIRFGSITAIPSGQIDTSGIEGVDPDLRVKPFFAEGSDFSIRAFITGAFKAEMGLESPDSTLLAAHNGHQTATPSGLMLNGALDEIAAPPVDSEHADGDGDGISNEIPDALVDHLEFYLVNYFRPGTYEQTFETDRGRRLLDRANCTSCHVQNLTIDRDRRVADVSTAYDRQRGVFNNLYASVEARFSETDDGSGFPTLKLPAQQSFVVENIYSDLKRHDLGPEFWERNFDGTYQKEIVTEPLWGVGTTAPYGHDGRSINLREVILRHGGEAEESKQAFERMSSGAQNAIINYLQSLVLFPPADTASDLDPGNPAAEAYPQNGHGSVDLSVLFNHPDDKE